MKSRFYILICVLIPGIQSIVAQNPGDSVFRSSIIHNINITFSQPNFWDSLMYYKQYSDSFNLSTQAMMGNIYIDGNFVDSVGISLKGNSSFGYPGQKKPIKIKLNEYVSGKKYDGLKTLNLNNNMLDPTMMREKLLLDFMNKKGLHAPRCTFTRVSYNGQYVGLYKWIESVDKEFIITNFNNWGGNLFKGDPMGTLNWINNQDSSYYPYYELHSNNTVNNWTDLVNFIDNVNNTPSVNFFDTLETDLNTKPCIQQWAARNLFVDLDGYFHAPHNYYLYHNTVTNKFEWISWDVSVAFGFYPMWFGDSTEKVSVLSTNNVLTSKLLLNTTYKTTYLNSICDYLDYFDTTIMSPIIDSIANRIYPDFAAEPDSNQMFPEQALFWTCDTLNINTPMGRIPALKKFITNRRARVLTELNSLNWVCPVAGIQEIAGKTAVEIFPNPFSLQALLRSEGIFKNATLTVYDPLGQVVKEIKNISGREIILQRDNLKTGFYFARIEQGGQVLAIKKIIIAD